MPLVTGNAKCAINPFDHFIRPTAPRLHGVVVRPWSCLCHRISIVRKMGTTAGADSKRCGFRSIWCGLSRQVFPCYGACFPRGLVIRKRVPFSVFIRSSILCVYVFSSILLYTYYPLLRFSCLDFQFSTAPHGEDRDNCLVESRCHSFACMQIHELTDGTQGRIAQHNDMRINMDDIAYVWSAN